MGKEESYQWKKIDSSLFINIFFAAINLEHKNINIAITAEALWNTNVFLRNQLQYGKWHENQETELILFFSRILKTKSPPIISSIWKNNLLLQENVCKLDLYRGSKALEIVLSLCDQPKLESFILAYMDVLKKNDQHDILLNVKNKIMAKKIKLQASSHDPIWANKRLARRKRYYVRMFDLINQVVDYNKNHVFFAKFEYQTHGFFETTPSNKPPVLNMDIEDEEVMGKEDAQLPVMMEEEDRCLYQPYVS